MENYTDLEKKVSAPKSGLHKAKRFSTLFIVAGAVMILGGIGNIISPGFNLNISADTVGEPPVPPVPNPPTPNADDVVPNPDTPGTFAFAPGWSMISGNYLQGYDITKFKEKGLILYSFNDPAYPIRDWSTYPYEGEGKNIIATNPLGYYVYNTTGATVSVSLSATNTTSADTFARGWHLLYWSGSEPMTKDQLLKAINLTYSNSETINADEAISNKYHRVSKTVYVVVNENSIDAQSVKELSNTDDAYNITKIPAKSYFWIYLRRTRARVTKITLGPVTPPSTPDTNIPTPPVPGDPEKVKIDAWLKANNLNECGDPPTTVYTGGSCLFNESTGTYTDKYTYLITKFPNKPWSS